MIIKIINVRYVISFKSEYYPPIAAYLNRPETAQPSCELMKPESRQIHVTRLPDRIKAGKYEAQSLRVFRLYPRFITGSIKLLQSLVEKARYHLNIITRNVISVNNFPVI